MRKYEDLNKIHENTLPPRSHYIPYDTPEKALKGERGASEYFMLLNGKWQFRYFKRDTAPTKLMNGIRLMFRRAGK